MINEDRPKIRADTDDNQLQFTIRHLVGPQYIFLFCVAIVAPLLWSILLSNFEAHPADFVLLAWALLLTVAFLFMGGQFLFFDRTICTVTPDKLTVRNRWLPLFWRQTIPSATIKQLFQVKRKGGFFGGGSYLYAETW